MDSCALSIPGGTSCGLASLPVFVSHPLPLPSPLPFAPRLRWLGPGQIPLGEKENVTMRGESYRIRGFSGFSQFSLLSALSRQSSRDPEKTCNPKKKCGLEKMCMNKQNNLRLLMAVVLGVAAVVERNIVIPRPCSAGCLSPCHPASKGRRSMFFDNYLCLLSPRIVSDKTVGHLLLQFSLSLDSSSVFIP